MTAPLLKWPGGKAGTAQRIRARFPAQLVGVLREPFAGSAAFSLSLGWAANCILNDANARLMEVHRWVRDAPDSVVDALRSLPGEEDWRDAYYDVRSAFNAERVPALSAVQAARLIWLNKACFNGLYRENAAGGFNVPRGSYARLALPSAERIREVSVALQPATLTTGAYKSTVANASEGDWLYVDPPYDGKTFTGYVAGGFGWADQLDLARACAAAVGRGVHVVMSNAATDRMLMLLAFHGFHVETFTTTRSIGRTAESRSAPAHELLAWAGPGAPLTPDPSLLDLLNLAGSPSCTSPT